MTQKSKLLFRNSYELNRSSTPYWRNGGRRANKATRKSNWIGSTTPSSFANDQIIERGKKITLLAMNCFQNLRIEIEKISDLRTERSFYPKLEVFLKQFASEELGISNDISVISEASSKVHEAKVGFPDLTIQRKTHDYQTVGWIEVKLPEDNLNDSKFQQQFNKYKDSLENIIFTNLREWSLWQWDEKGKAKKIIECLFDIRDQNASTEGIKKLLERFFEGKALEIRTPKQLALALARKTRLLSQQVQENLEEAIENGDKSNDLLKLQSAFSETLIKDIETHQFANMAAETIAYSFFLAALEHERRGHGEDLTFTTAIDYLPQSVPILYDLYSLIGTTAKKSEPIQLTVNSLVEQFKKADMGKIHKKLSSHAIGQDPVIHFYEPFLAEYDPKEREARGVYYTPKPIVDYIVRSADELLKSNFGKEIGLEDRSVQLLDPATGTGTFLMSAIEMIYERKKKQLGSLGEEIVKKDFAKTAQDHILKHFYGFELMIAPYAIAHLKLTLLLEEFGFKFEMTQNNEDPDDDRMKIYLTNTLDKPQKTADKGQLELFSFHESISEEGELASKIKASEPIMVIIGNPPYSNFGRMNRNEWILGLLNDYKKDLEEKKINIDDDFIKFIRFAQWKIEQTGEGIVAMITSNTFVDGITHRQMRKTLLEVFDEIYIYNLHGNIRKGEVCPDGSKDENVFDIMTGVSINIFVKNQKCDNETLAKVFYQDAWGKSKEKLEILEKSDIKSTPWEEVKPLKPYYFFTPKDLSNEDYFEFTNLKEIFLQSVTGVESQKDKVCIKRSKNSIKTIIDDFIGESPDEEIREEYDIKDSRDWKLSTVREHLKYSYDRNNFKTISYRPFDSRHTYFDRNFIAYPRKPLMDSLSREGNFAIICSRQSSGEHWYNIFISDKVTERCFLSIKTKEGGYVFPLFLNLEERTLNISKQFLEKFDKYKANELDIFDYIYGILHLPQYREKYIEQLKINFPYIPTPEQIIKVDLLKKEIDSPFTAFKIITKAGTKLRELHTLKAAIFHEETKWGISVGGKEDMNKETDWVVKKIKYESETSRIYINENQYFEGISKDVWEFRIGSYQVLDKWLKERGKEKEGLTLDELKHYMKIIISLRETIETINELKTS